MCNKRCARGWQIVLSCVGAFGVERRGQGVLLMPPIYLIARRHPALEEGHLRAAWPGKA